MKELSAIPLPSDKLRFLVVDDNVDAAQLLAMFLETLGHEVFVEYHPQDALELANRITPDIFLLDIGLPLYDGYELARRLRAYPQTHDAVMIAVTGYGQKHDIENAFAAGFDHHLVKPLDMTALQKLIAEISRQRQFLDRLSDAGPRGTQH
jgi:CheY-like chemotaxis protein